MTFVMGDVAGVLAEFLQMTDTQAILENNPKFCGERLYELTDLFPFLTLVVPTDPWQSLS